MRVLRVFPDHGHEWPLWEDGSAQYAMVPADYGLSDELSAALRRWCDDWESHCPLDGTWPSPEYGRHWGREGVGLSRWLQREVDPLVNVSYEADDLY